MADKSVEVGDLDAVPAVVTALGDEVLLGVGIAARFTIILDHGRRVIVER
jgi:hypothetical protein